MRRNYQLASLLREQLASDPIAQFCAWHDQLKACELPEWFETNAMTLSTIGVNARVSSRVVLLKDVSESGFCFFTNYRSQKARELAAHTCASLNFYWPPLERQVRVEGVVSQTTAEISDGYFASRPFMSRLAAIVSPQSEAIDDAFDLESQVRLLAEKHSDQNVPRPEYWGGYCLVPDRIEFWQGRPSRLHDRFVYSRRSDGWAIDRLAP